MVWDHPRLMFKTLVVLPTYQEAENILEVLRQVRAVLPGADILVIDDSSPDGTSGLAKAAALDLGGIDVLVRPEKAGLGGAYRTGFREATDRGYQVLVEMDSDLSHDPSALPSLLTAIDEGADMAIGSRYVPGGEILNWPVHRRLLSRYGNRYSSFVLRLDVSDTTSGFRAYRTDILGRMGVDGIRADGYAFHIEMVYRLVKAGGRVVERPITFRDRDRGVSKMSPRIVVEALALTTWWGLRDRLRSLLSRRHHRRMGTRW